MKHNATQLGAGCIQLILPFYHCHRNRHASFAVTEAVGKLSPKRLNVTVSSHLQLVSSQALEILVSYEEGMGKARPILAR